MYPKQNREEQGAIVKVLDDNGSMPWMNSLPKAHVLGSDFRDGISFRMFPQGFCSSFALLPRLFHATAYFPLRLPLSSPRV